MNEQIEVEEMQVGLRFAIYPMADDFTKIIKGALRQVDTSQVDIKTDDITTLVQGSSFHVFHLAAAVFIHAAKNGTHVVLNGTFFQENEQGAAGKRSGTRSSGNDAALAEENVETAAQVALYPLNSDEYLKIREEQIETAKNKGVFTKEVPEAVRLDGEAGSVFAALEEMFLLASGANQDGQTAMTVVTSANSPSKKDK